MIRGSRLLICGEMTIDCCPDRVAELKLKYPGKVEVQEGIMIDHKLIYCGMEPCLRGGRDNG